MLDPWQKWLVLLVCGAWSVSGWAGEGSDAAPETAPATPVTEPEPEVPEVRPVTEGVPALQLSPDFVTPSLAFGGYFPTPQMESGVIRVEPFTVRAAVNAGLGYTDNVTLSNTNKRSSVYLTVIPGIVVGLEGANQRYYATYRGNYGRYFASSADDYANHNFALAALNQWTGRLRTQAGYDFTRGHDPRGAVNQTVVEPQQWSLHRLRASATYGAAEARAQLEGNVGYLRRQYSDNTANTGLDYEQYDVGATFFYRVAPKTTASVAVNHADISHDDPLLDATENRYSVGLRWEATAKTSVSGRVAYLTRHPSNAAIAEFSGANYELGATWLPTSYSTVSLSALRTTSESLQAGSNFIVVNTATAVWDHAWFDRIRSTVSYRYGRESYEGLGRTDTYNSVSGRISYGLHRRLRVGAEFRRDSRDSPDPVLEYQRNLTLLTLESSL